jgi:hypothetical protein
MTALFYDLLKPAGRSLSLLAAFIGLTGYIIKTGSAAAQRVKAASTTSTMCRISF